jgi:N-acetylglucosaminyldiphosphoundecaprenol N-acetyl-beta-D-mannosaminyltransferase
MKTARRRFFRFPRRAAKGELEPPSSSASITECFVLLCNYKGLYMASQPGTQVEHRRIGGVPAAIVSETELVSCMVGDCQRNRAGDLGRPVVVADTNGQAISMQASDSDYARALEAADIVHADGQFIVWLSRMFGGKAIPERTATTDFIHAAAQAAAESGLGFFLLGGSEDINRRCAERLVEVHPGLKIVGRRNGYFDESVESAVLAEIRNSGADVVWVGLGKPKEQHFALRAREALGCAWIVTCGGCFNFVAGDYRRAPGWMQRAGLEWLHRMATGPRYLVRRYLVTIPHALWLVLLHDVLKVGSRPRGGGEQNRRTG